MHNSTKSALLGVGALTFRMMFHGGFLAGVLTLIGLYFGYKGYNAKLVQIPHPLSIRFSGKKGKSAQILISSKNLALLGLALNAFVLITL